MKNGYNRLDDLNDSDYIKAIALACGTLIIVMFIGCVTLVNIASVIF